VQSVPLMIELCRPHLMVETHRLYLLWWRYTYCTFYGGDTQTVPFMVEIHILYLLWWRHTDCTFYGGDTHTVPFMVEIHRLYFLMILIMSAVMRYSDGCRLSMR